MWKCRTKITTCKKIPLLPHYAVDFAESTDITTQRTAPFRSFTLKASATGEPTVQMISPPPLRMTGQRLRISAGMPEARIISKTSWFITVLIFLYLSPFRGARTVKGKVTDAAGTIMAWLSFGFLYLWTSFNTRAFPISGISNRPGPGTASRRCSRAGRPGAAACASTAAATSRGACPTGACTASTGRSIS